MPEEKLTLVLSWTPKFPATLKTLVDNGLFVGSDLPTVDAQNVPGKISVTWNSPKAVVHLLSWELDFFGETLDVIHASGSKPNTSFVPVGPAGGPATNQVLGNGEL